MSIDTASVNHRLQLARRGVFTTPRNDGNHRRGIARAVVRRMKHHRRKLKEIAIAVLGKVTGGFGRAQQPQTQPQPAPDQQRAAMAKAAQDFFGGDGW